ncbi:MAG: hypothetical protein AMS19_02490 [Gemmatimonas sp. SG8_23]|nr:MAG: hypothetical protein AMS19_02490 [Gemmatimonas sp. SG8_23]
MMKSGSNSERDHIPREADLLAEILERFPSVEAFSRRIGVNKGLLYRLQNGKGCNLETAIRIARGLEMTTDELAELVGISPELLELQEEAS